MNYALNKLCYKYTTCRVQLFGPFKSLFSLSLKCIGYVLEVCLYVHTENERTDSL